MLLRVAIFAALGGFLYGYDLGLIGGALLSMQEEQAFSEPAVELIVAAAKIGAFFGTFLGGGLMLYYGRRTTIALDSVFFMLGPITMASAAGLWGLVVGRALVGLGIGISAVVVPAYLGELSPAKLRGRIVEVYEVVLCIGMLAAVLADAALAHAPSSWRWMVGLPVVPGIILSAAMWMLPESPRWLVVDGRLDEALAVIHVMYTKERLPFGAQQSTAEVEHELLELWSSVEKDKDAVRERTAAARAARAARFAHSTAPKPVRKARGAVGPGWLQLQEVPHQGPSRSPLQDAQHSPPAAAPSHALGGAPTPGALRSTGKAPPSPTVSQPLQVAQSQAQPSAAEPAPALDSQGPVGLALPRPVGLEIVHPRVPAPLHDSEPTQEGSPDASRSLRRQLSDPTSPLYRSLSQIPTGLRPIRTTSFSTDGEGSPESPAARPEPHKSLRNAASVPRRRSVGPGPGPAAVEPAQPSMGYWAVQLGVIADMWRVVRGPESRAVRLALWIAVIDQAMASTAIVNYAPALIQQSSLSSSTSATLWTGAVTGSKIVGSVASMFLVDSAGRRPLLIWGSTVCGAALLVIGVADSLTSTALMVAGMCLFIMAFSASYAGVFWVLLSELFSMSAKAPAAAAATAVLFAAGALPDLVFLTLHSWLGPFAFVCYATVAFSGCIYCYLQLPETKGCTLAQVQALLSKETPPDPAGASASPEAASRHIQEEMMRPAVPQGRGAVARHVQRTEDGSSVDRAELMEQGHWGPQWVMRQWAGYTRFEH